LGALLAVAGASVNQPEVLTQSAPKMLTKVEGRGGGICLPSGPRTDDTLVSGLEYLARFLDSRVPLCKLFMLLKMIPRSQNHTVRRKKVRINFYQRDQLAARRVNDGRLI
jgi:hypothetical protein